MGDVPEVRVFDSVTAAVANSAQPAPPPYAAVEDPSSADAAVAAPDPEPVPVAAKPSGRRTQAKTGGVAAQAGTAGVGVAAKDAKAQGPA
jgi:hypothetical protein